MICFHNTRAAAKETEVALSCDGDEGHVWSLVWRVVIVRPPAGFKWLLGVGFIPLIVLDLHANVVEFVIGISIRSKYL